MLKKLQTIVLALLVSTSTFAVVPNGTFESWTDSLPDAWVTNNSGDSLVPITRTTDAHSGTYALKGEVFDFHGGFVPPNFHTESTSGLGYAINNRFVGLTGWYKSDLVGTNFITAVVTIYAANGISFGIGYFRLPPVANYTRFYIPINYSSAGNGRYAYIEFYMADTSGLGFNIGSNYIIDDLNLELVSDVGQIGATPFSIGPNPAVNQINIIGDFKSGQPYEFRLFNSIGEMVLTTNYKSIMTSLPPIDVSDLPDGMYLLFLSDTKNTTSQRVLVSH